MLQENLLEKNNNKKILVTGGSGLVGNELIKQLLYGGNKVKAIYHTTPINISHPDLEIVNCDILDVIALEEILQSVSNVYHCAAIVSYIPKDKRKILKINVEGTANVVNGCLDAKVKKLVYVSSVAALGRIRDQEMITEKMNWSEESSNSTYGKSKYFAEMEVWRGIAEGLKAVIVNPSLILGGENWERSSSAIFKKAYEEFKWYTEGASGFVDVRDVARAIILLMNSNITSERFILNGENISYQKIFSSIAKCFKKKPPYKRVTPFYAELMWRIEKIKSAFKGSKPLLTRETIRTAQAKIYFDNSKILEALPEFKFTKIEDAIEFTCATLKEKYSL